MTPPPLPASSSPSYGLPRASSPHLYFTSGDRADSQARLLLPPVHGAAARGPLLLPLVCGAAARARPLLLPAHGAPREPDDSSLWLSGRRHKPSACSLQHMKHEDHIRFLVKKAEHYGIAFTAAPAVLFLVLLAVLLVYHL
ncbi:hypothetical protein EJB05_33804, partial [Eragrostis curvula]